MWDWFKKKVVNKAIELTQEKGAVIDFNERQLLREEIIKRNEEKGLDTPLEDIL